jgi:outer membrane receptor for Fe3+-dicitrate
MPKTATLRTNVMMFPELKNPFNETEKRQNITIAIKKTIFSCVHDTFLNHASIVSSKRYSQSSSRDWTDDAELFPAV